MGKNKISDIAIDYSLHTTRKHKIGNRLVDSSGNQYQYAKLDFGVVGKVKGKIYRKVLYGWIPYKWPIPYKVDIPKKAIMLKVS